MEDILRGLVWTPPLSQRVSRGEIPLISVAPTPLYRLKRDRIPSL